MDKKQIGLTAFAGAIYGRGFAGVMGLAALMSMMAAGARMLQIVVMGRIVDAVSQGLDLVWQLFGIITLGLVTHLVFNALWGAYSSRHTTRLMDTLRRKLARRLCHAEYAALEPLKDGDVLSVVTRDLEGIRAWAQVLFQMGFIPVKLGLSLVACLWISWKLSLVVIPLTPVIVVLAMAVSGSLYRFHVEEKTASGQLNALLNDTISFMVVVKTFCLEHLFARKNRQALSRVIAARDRVAGKEATVMALNTCLGHVGFVLIFLTGSLLVLRGEMMIGDMIAFIFLANFVGEGMSIVQSIPVTYRGACAARQRLEQVLSLPQEPAGEPGGTDSGRAAAGPAARDIFAFEDVSFAYDPGHSRLGHVSLAIRQGERIAIVGPSGSGKSTLFKLLCGLYRPTAGALRWQGQEVSAVPVTRLRAGLAVVPQDSFLFSDTLANNVRIGRPDAAEADVVAACRQARIHEVITRLPDGYATQAVAVDKRLSRGQMQRLNLARAFLKDAPVLLLDEPTSALDLATHAALERHLVEGLRDRTVIVIAHRLTHPEAFDRILVMDAGQVAGIGHHDDLLRTCAAYRIHLGALSHEDPMMEVTHEGRA